MGLEQKCKYCRFFSGDGKCRRYSPDPTEDGFPIWPTVFDTDWCGEFEQGD